MMKNPRNPFRGDAPVDVLPEHLPGTMYYKSPVDDAVVSVSTSSWLGEKLIPMGHVPDDAIFISYKLLRPIRARREMTNIEDFVSFMLHRYVGTSYLEETEQREQRLFAHFGSDYP